MLEHVTASQCTASVLTIEIINWFQYRFYLTRVYIVISARRGWLGGVVVRASDSRSRGHGFDPGRTAIRQRLWGLGKLFTPTCLDADSLRYYMVSLKPGTFTFISAK